MKVFFNTIFIASLIFVSCKSPAQLMESSSLEPALVSKYSSDKEIDIPTNDSITISGSFSYGGLKVLTILIAGSGPTDRNCNSVVGVNTDAFKMFADSLKHAGISSYRYDKRGVGKSTKVKASDVDFNDFVSDANEIVDYFKDDFEHINIIGHSEGALIGTLVCQRNSYVDSFVNLCGTSISIDSIALEQLERYPKLIDEARKHFDEIRSGKPLSEVNPMLASLFNPSVIKFFTSIMAYNPSKEQAKVSIPVFIISGTCDIQVPEKHAKKLYASLVPNQKNKKIRIDGMGHVLKKNKLDCSNAQDAYTNAEQPLHPELSKQTINFIKSMSDPNK